MKRTRTDVAERFRWQAGWCGRLGSPLYRDLLDHAATDIEGGGPVWDMVAADDASDRDGVLPGAQALRLMGAVHRLVLDGRAPELAEFYPSAGGAVRAGVWQSFTDLLSQQREALAQLVAHPVQTNEPGRSAAMLGGFLEVARQTGLPLRLLEVGASAGLNLRWDRYSYTAPGGSWGDPGSPVRFDPAFVDGAPPLHVRPRVAERRGCDPDPLDAAAHDDRLTLLSYVWPDQEQRLAQLRAAFDLAADVPVAIDREEAVEWLERQLGDVRNGVTTVVFHSIVLPYLSAHDVTDLKHTIERAGARARDDAPLAWLSMEAGGEQAEVRLTTWPAGESHVLARATFHGPPVRWLGG